MNILSHVVSQISGKNQTFMDILVSVVETHDEVLILIFEKNGSHVSVHMSDRFILMKTEGKIWVEERDTGDIQRHPCLTIIRIRLDRVTAIEKDYLGKERNVQKLRETKGDRATKDDLNLVKVPQHLYYFYLSNQSQVKGDLVDELSSLYFLVNLISLVC